MTLANKDNIISLMKTYKNRNVLIVCSFFTPDRNVGAKRMTSLAKHLINNGYNVNLITNKKFEKQNEVHLINTIFVEEENGNINGLKKFLINWKKYSKAFIEMCSITKIDIVIVSVGLFYSLGVVSPCRKKNIPCVCDFRDPLVFDFRGFVDTISFKKNVKRVLNYFYEIFLINRCSKAVTVSSGWVNLFKKIHPFNKEKFVLIENGYNDDIEIINTTIKNDKFIIGNFGKLSYYSKRYAKIFFNAIGNINNVNILQVGNYEKDLEYMPNINRLEITGFIDYKNGLKKLEKCNALLIVDNRKLALGTKIYDYIRLNKPIIYVGKKGTAIEELVLKCNGYSCSNESDIIEAIKKIRENDYINNLDIGDYAISRSNKKWINLIESILEKKN